MSDIAIKFENISKQYRLGLVSTRTLSHDLNRWWTTNIRGKDDPYLKIGETNDRATKGDSEYVWALRNIDFEVKQGEVLGIIGKNGAGKSTLLKILSRVTTPTTGRISANGRIASLLEVGTGFHPEMTGRENIYMNGAIMGMSKAEIRRKLNEIVDFSGVERYIDTPTKRYSSGMTVRLGFAIAAYLDPEILVVDEVLAVGDAEFQRKAIGKMQEVSREQGRTVLFVSHNMTAIENLCNEVCILEDGTISFVGNANEVIRKYLESSLNNKNIEISQQIGLLTMDEDFRLSSFYVSQDDNLDNFTTAKPIEISLNYLVKRKIMGLRIGFDIIENNSASILFRTFHDDQETQIKPIKEGIYNSKAIVPAHLLKEGNYTIKPAIGIHNLRWIIHEEVQVTFDVNNISGLNKIYADHRPGIIMPNIEWITN